MGPTGDPKAGSKWKTMKTERFTHKEDVEWPENGMSPSSVAEGELLIIKGNNLICFKCPCKCGTLINLPVSPKNEGRNWGMTVDENGVTLVPSLQQKGHKCNSHFFIRNSQVIWC